MIVVRMIVPFFLHLQGMHEDYRNQVAIKAGKITSAFPILLLLAAIGYGCGQPIVLKKDVPADIPADIRSDIEKLSSRLSDVRGNGAFNLGEKGERASPATPFLVKLLNDRSYLVWKSPDLMRQTPTSPAIEAIVAMGKIKDPRAVKPLIGVLNDKDKNIQESAVVALAAMNDPLAVKAVIGVLNDRNSSVRLVAARGLVNRINDPDATESLINYALEGNSPEAVKILSKIENPKVAGTLIRLLKSGNQMVRESAVKAIGDRKDTGAVEILIEALKDPSLSVRRAVAQVLGELNDRRAIGPLLEEWKDNKGIVKYWGILVEDQVVTALKKLTGMDFGNDRGKWLEWYELYKAR